MVFLSETTAQDVEQEVDLSSLPAACSSVNERREIENLANLFSIITAVDHLERAFVDGSIPNEEYEKQCTQLIAQFQVLRQALKDRYPDVKVFMEDQGMECSLAAERLLGTGLAATKLYQSSQTKDDAANDSLHVFETSQHFITLMDALKLSMRAVDEILPTLKELQSSLTRIPSLPPNLEGAEKVMQWLRTLNNMRASEDLDEDQARQLAMDLENAYTAFHKWLRERGR